MKVKVEDLNIGDVFYSVNQSFERVPRAYRVAKKTAKQITANYEFSGEWASWGTYFANGSKVYISWDDAIREQIEIVSKQMESLTEMIGNPPKIKENP